MKYLQWNVFVGDFNSSSIETINVFQHSRFFTDLCAEAKKYRSRLRKNVPCVKIYDHGEMVDVTPTEAFLDAVHRDLMYYFWSKCEWEVVITSWPQGRGELKIDAYSQINMNWDLFSRYVLDNIKLCIPSKNPRNFTGDKKNG